jgi:putative transposase
MPRRARLALPHVPLHIIQRGNNRQACFYADEDYRFYLDWLREHADKAGCRVHAYVLMTIMSTCWFRQNDRMQRVT